jgi:hypothetical protein
MSAPEYEIHEGRRDPAHGSAPCWSVLRKGDEPILKRRVSMIFTTRVQAERCLAVLVADDLRNTM